MTRKDYVRFAAMFKANNVCRLHDESLHAGYLKAIANICDRTADIFAADNANFDRDKFLKACGVES